MALIPLYMCLLAGPLARCIRRFDSLHPLVQHYFRLQAVFFGVYRYGAGFACPKAFKRHSVKDFREHHSQADLWRNRRIRPAQVQNGQRPAEELPEMEQAVVKVMKAIQRINTELNHRKGKE